MLKVALAVGLGAAIIVFLASLALAQSSLTCVPRPAGGLSSDTVVYYGAVADDLLWGLARREDVPIPGPGKWLDVFDGLIVESRGPDTVVMLLRDGMVCPVTVPRGAWEAVRRTVLGLGA